MQQQQEEPTNSRSPFVAPSETAIPEFNLSVLEAFALVNSVVDKKLET